MRLNQRSNFSVQLGNLTFYLREPRLGLAFQERNILGLGTVAQSRAVLDQPGTGNV